MSKSFVIEVDDNEVISAMNRMAQQAASPGGILKAIGEALLADTRRRFEASTDPWGMPWKANSQVTIDRYVAGFSNTRSKRDGGLTKKGQKLATDKKPLLSRTNTLFQQFHYQTSNDGLFFYNSMIYAAIQNFGGKKSQFPNLWGDIPARPFMPADQSGQLAPNTREMILNIVREALLPKTG